MFGQGGLYKNLWLNNFIDNHDVNRIASNLKKKEYMANVYTLLFTIPGIPSIYYGSEWGILGSKENGSDDALRPSLDLEKLLEEDQSMVEYISKLSRIKRESEILCSGIYEQVLVKNEQLVFARVYNNKRIYVALNLGEQEINLSFKINNEKSLRDVMHKDRVYASINGNISISIPAFESIILEENDV